MLIPNERNNLLASLRQHGAAGNRARAFAELQRLRRELDDARARAAAAITLGLGVDDLEAADDLLEVAQTQYDEQRSLMERHGWLAPTASRVEVYEGNFAAEAYQAEIDNWNELIETARGAQRERFAEVVYHEYC